MRNLKIKVYTDASFKTRNNNVRSVEGRMLMNGDKASTILWRSKKLARVSGSTKTTKTLAMDKTCDNAIYMARMIWGINLILSVAQLSSAFHNLSCFLL